MRFDWRRATHELCGGKHKGCPYGEFGQPEIVNLCLPARGDKNVRRLGVAMHDALRMSCIQRIGNLDSQVEQRFYL